MAAATVDLGALVSEKAEFLSGRLRELVSSGQGLVRAQFGLDLGLKPELYPGWMVLSTAAAGLLLLLGALSWAALCGGLLPGKQRGSPVTHPGGGGGGGGTGGEPVIKPQHFIKNAKPEEQKKRNKKKSTGDKKVQSNGGVVVVSPEEVNISETAVSSKPSPEIKAEKQVQQAPTTTQAKKNKRKAKAEGKPTQSVYTIDGKEDDGAWVTKVSSREKRQQRRKDRGPEDSGAPGAAEGPTGHGEPPAVTNSRKHRESQQRRSSGKGDAGSAPASSGWREEPAMAGGLEGEKWSSGSSASRHRAQPESTQCWGQETTQGTWSGVDGRMKADLNPVSFSMLGLNATESQPIDLQWDRHPDVSDEWSGFNGMAAVDSSSDWNAPAEHWGNYEEPPVLVTPAAPPKEHAAPRKVSEDEKEVEDPTEGTAKSKKKKKKKKKAEDDTQTVSEVSREAPPITPSSQKKTEKTAESSKSFQKKKVRRET